MGCGASAAKSYAVDQEAQVARGGDSSGSRSPAHRKEPAVPRSRSEPPNGPKYDSCLARDPSHWAAYDRAATAAPPLPAFPPSLASHGRQNIKASKPPPLVGSRAVGSSAGNEDSAPLLLRHAGFGSNIDDDRGSQSLPEGVKLLDLGSFARLEVLDETPMSMVVRMKGQRGKGGSVAGKCVRKDSAVHEDGGHLNEVRMLQKLGWTTSPGIVGLVGVCDNATEFWTVMELCGGGRLEVWLQRSPGTTGEVTRQLLEAVQHLHSLLICHLDVKPDNVLLTTQGEVKLCDFVTSCQLSAQGQLITGFCGTDGFRAPEVTTDGQGYCGLLADVFSLGKTLQAVSKIDPTWRELIRACRDMIGADPQRRPRVYAVRCAVFGGTPPGLGYTAVASGCAKRTQQPQAVELDFATLEAVASRDVLPQGRKEAAPKSAYRPPDLRSQRAPGLSDPAKLSSHSVTNPVGVGKSSAGRSSSQARHSAVEARRPAPQCGRPTCIRIGACLCDDCPPSDASQWLLQPKKGLRRSSTP